LWLDVFQAKGLEQVHPSAMLERIYESTGTKQKKVELIDNCVKDSPAQMRKTTKGSGRTFLELRRKEQV
jgi:hypothetical protein